MGNIGADLLEAGLRTRNDFRTFRDLGAVRQLSTIKSADLRSLNEISLTGISRSPLSIFQDENNAVNHRSLDPSKELLQFADERFWKMTSVSACTKFALGTTPDPVLSPCFSHQLRRSSPTRCEEAEFENDFQKKCRKGAKFAAHTAFSAILGEISCLFSLALEFFTRFRGGSFRPLTHLSGKQLSALSH